MKRLKDSTIKYYNVKQLSKHLNRLMNLHEHRAPYRIDSSYGVIYEYDKEVNSYFLYCCINEASRELIISLITSQYMQWGVFNNQGFYFDNVGSKCH